MTISPEQQQVLLAAARTAIREALRGNTQYSIQIPGDPILAMPAGCFVTLHEAGTHRLRGCMGRLQSSDPLIKTVHETAHLVLEDPRFRHMPVRAEDLLHIDLEISVLSPLEPAETPLDFDAGEDGIYLIHMGRTGTFLPQVGRETGWSREQLLCRLCQEKMGLGPFAWQDPGARLLKYKAVVIGPVPFVEPVQVAAAPPQPAPAK